MSSEETDITSAEATLNQTETDTKGDSDSKKSVNKSTTKPTMSQTTASNSTLQKIAPKPAAVKQTAVTGGKIVYIKSPNGTPQPIRIGGGQLLGPTNATATTTTNTNTTVSNPAIQFIKTLDGNFLQIKNKNVVSMQKSSTPTTVSSANAQTSAIVSSSTSNNTRFVVKSGTGSHLILSTPATTANAKVTTAASTSSGNNKRTLTVSQAQQMGLITSAKLKELVSAANANKANPSTTTTNTVVANKPALILPASGATTSSALSTTAGALPKGQPTILNKGLKPIQSQKILIQSTNNSNNSGNTNTVSNVDTKSAKLTGTQNVVKIPQNSQLRAVNVAGRGLQYVRVLNSVASSGSTASTTNAKQLNVTNGGRPQSVFVQRKIVPPQQQVVASNATSKQQQFITKKLEVTPIASNTNANRIVKKETINQTTNPPKPAAVLLNNTQKNILNTPIDIKPIPSSQNQSFEITASKNEPSSPSNSPQKVIYRSYKLSEEKESKSPEPQYSTLLYSTLKLPSPEPMEGIRRKHCNCTKSQCLKLYCDCFANGEFCSNCNCKECFNTLEKEDERQKAIKICLERNPHAFKPKIGKARDQSDTLRRHTKGCNCKRSGCLKNYCECYEAKIVCSGNCKCIGCRNIDDTFDHNNDRDTSQYDSHQLVKRSYDQNDETIKTEPVVPAKKPCNFITPDVIEATIQCVIAQADDCQKNHYDAKTSERKILEEFGRCLVEIIDFSKKNNDNSDE